MYRTERLIQSVVVIAVLGAAGVSHAATPSEFYLNLLSRGVSEFDAGRFESAASQLRIAAFGLMDAVDRYQTAQIYLAISSDRTADGDGARNAARRVVSAEKIGKTYGSLALPAGIRTTFDALARTMLTPGEVSILATSPKPVQTAPAVKPPATQAPLPAAKASPTPATTEAKPPSAPATTEAKPPAAPATTEAKPSATPATTEAKPPAAPTTTPPPQQPPPKPQEPADVEPKRETTTAPAPAPAPVTRDIPAACTEAERALHAANLSDARRIYRELLDAQLTHEQALRVAEGLYRVRDFAFALRAFERAGALRKGEEPYGYYIAVALYETGQHAAAKKELTAVLPFIEITPDVASYRAKIESSID
ncbi:MAG TPA: hypothetical protein VNA69_05825 [Thermoanaerobaculia bacterium]|nr:hypothetical protein [Thermoanaerobaculia bacterium]